MSTFRKAALPVAIAIISLPTHAAKPGEEEGGNNLSTPVIWSDGITKQLRTVEGGFPEDALFEGLTSTCVDDPFTGLDCYQQQDPYNIWQAESWDATGNETSYGNTVPGGAINNGVLVDEIDWGDNLEARDWNVNSIIRLEVVLWQLLGGTGNHALPAMTGYEMSYLYGQGPSEMWGTTSNTYSASEATVYSNCARLTIQKIAELDDLDEDGELPDLGLEWDPLDTVWLDQQGEPLPAFFNSAVWEAGTGSGFFSAEINLPGRVIYGYGWNVRKLGDGDGVYRLTFSLDGTFADDEVNEIYNQQCYDGGVEVPLNTFLEDAIVRVAEEDPEGGDEENNETGGGVAMIDDFNNLTYMDVKVLPRSGGGGTGGNKDGDKGKGKDNDNSHGNGGPNK